MRGRPISELRLVEDLGVHPPTPPYVDRPHDTELRAVVARAAAGESGVAIMVSDSTAGKTRAIAEALRGLPADWRLVEPVFDPALVAPRTVVWLNEAQRFFLEPPAEVAERFAGELRRCLAGSEPVLVLGTLWPDYWQRLVRRPERGDPDVYAVTRALIEQHGIRVPAVFSAAAMAEARDGGDALLVEAVGNAADGEVTQYLAGVPDLLSRYELGSAEERAVIHVAMDARRFGHGEHLPAGLLRDAATAYLTRTEQRRLRPGWFVETVAGLTFLGKADTSVLDAGPDDTYRLADYLDQHGRRVRFREVPADPFWAAVDEHIRDSDTRFVLARHAVSRYRLAIGARLLASGAAAGHLPSVRELAPLLEHAGHREEAERVARRGTFGPDEVALLAVADARQDDDDAGATRLYRWLADSGTNASVLPRVLNGLQELGEIDAAHRMRRKIAETASIRLGTRVEVMEELGDQLGAEKLALGNQGPGAVDVLLVFRLVSRDLDGLCRLLEMVVATEHVCDLSICVKAASILPRLDLWVALVDRAIATGDAEALLCAAETVNHHDRRSAQLLAHKAFMIGGGRLMTRMWPGLSGQDDWRVPSVTTAAEAGVPEAATALAELSRRDHDLDTAERLAQQGLRGGDQRAMGLLAGLREQAGEHEEAERIAEAAARSDNHHAICEVVTVRETTDPLSAEALALRALEWPSVWGILTLITAREHRGPDVVERLVMIAVDTGSTDPLDDVVHSDAADERWRRIWRFGLDADGTDAEPW